MGGKKKKFKKWGLVASILLIVTIIDIFIPDPVVLVDEIVLMTMTIFAMIKSFK